MAFLLVACCGGVFGTSYVPCGWVFGDLCLILAAFGAGNLRVDLGFGAVAPLSVLVFSSHPVFIPFLCDHLDRGLVLALGPSVIVVLVVTLDFPMVQIGLLAVFSSTCMFDLRVIRPLRVGD